MRPLSLLLFAALICRCLPAAADVISPEVAAAENRLRDNPKTYDRVDNFCSDKKPGAPCTIWGTVFSGGGAGTCVNAVNPSGSTIDLTCVRNDAVQIDRKLPDGGFVDEPYLCELGEDKETGQKWNCTPTIPTPSDQFCQGKSTGSRCTVELTYQGKKEWQAGICSEAVETQRFYYQGHRTATRQVIRCDPPVVASHTYTPVSWRKKLLP